MITCKSPVAVMKAALELGRQLFADHSHRFSPHAFTQPQLFACLALREHQKKSYRGVEGLLVDCSDLRAAIGLRRTPDHNTLCRAFQHLVKSRSMNRALDVQVEQAKAMGLDVSGGDAKPSAMDSTCFESHHVSRHFERRHLPKRPGNRPGRVRAARGRRRSGPCRSCRSPLPARAT
jgi:hypothetical protein